MSDDDKVFTIGKRVKNDSNNWESINLDKYVIEKPIVLVLGGSGVEGTRDESEKLANGVAKTVDTLFNAYKDEIDILSLSYNKVNIYNNDQLQEKTKELTVKLFKPLINKNNKTQTLKNFRNITIFSYCAGDSYVLPYICLNICDDLEQDGYSKEDQKEILSSIFKVSYASQAFYNDRIFYEFYHSIKSLNIISLTDGTFVGHDYYMIEKIIENIETLQIPEEDKKQITDLYKTYEDSEEGCGAVTDYILENNKCYIEQYSNQNELFLTTGNIFKSKDNFVFDHENDHTIRQFRNENFETNDKTTLVGDYVSRCLSCAFCNSLANSILNNKSKKYIPLDMKEMRLDIENILNPLNERKGQPLQIINKEK